MRKYLVVALLTVAISSGFAENLTKEQKKARSEAGRLTPTITMTAPADKIKAMVLSDMVGSGWRVESDSQYSFEFTRRAEGSEAFGAMMGMGNGYSDMPIRHARFTFVPDGNQTTVTYDATITVQMRNGKVNTQTGSYPFRGELRQLLESITARASATQ